MKKPIIIISAGVVVISLLLLVNEKWLKENSAPPTAGAKQQESAAEGQGSSSEQKTTDKPTSKPPVYDLTNKAHWYDPETTIGFQGSSQTLAEWLEPFKPNAREFQIIAQYENERKKLEESLSEDEYYSVEGRLRFLDELMKLNRKLQEQLGEDRHKFYAEVRELETGYYDTWKVLTANGISEERVSEFRELADEFNQQMHGYPLYRAEREVVRHTPNDFRIDSDEEKRIAQSFRDRIEKEFGKQVLDDIFDIGDSLFFMSGLDKGVDPSWHLGILFDPKRQERLKTLYNVDFKIVGDDDVGIREAERHEAESERLAKREMEFMEKWAEYHEQQQAEPEEASGDSP